MFLRLLAALAVSISMAGSASAGRVALVIGQNNYKVLHSLDNPAPDARSMAALLAAHGFEVISCDGKEPGCFDLDRAGLIKALAQLKTRAAGADLALVYYAGHGAATEEGNMLAPADAKVNCATGAITDGVPVERLMLATAPARNKLLILDACRDNPLGDICPGLKGKKLSFTRIEAGPMQGLLLVTSTQFGQQALDGFGAPHSPFAAALFAALKANPAVYFEQVMNEVARATYTEAQKDSGFIQIPGKVVGGAAPADCLAGAGCVGDERMAALALDNERLAADASGLRNILASEEAARGKPYTNEERKARVAQLEATLASIGKSTDPLRQEARRLINDGNVSGGEAKLDEALDADEKALAEAERVAAERRKAAAQGARDLAVLAEGRDALKAVAYYRRATRLDPSDGETWRALAEAALEAGQTAEAKTAFEQAALKAKDGANPRLQYWATLGLGDVAQAQGNLPVAQRFYEIALAIAQPIVKADPSNAGWQRDLSVSYEKAGDVLVAQGSLPEALKAYRDSLGIRDRLAKADPGNARWQRDLSVSHNKAGDVLVAQGSLPEALKAYRDSLGIADRLAKADPNNAGWQRDLSVSYIKVGNVLVAQGNLPEALKSFQGSLAIADRLAKADPNNAGWQRDLSVSYDNVGGVLVAQGNLPEALKSFQAGLAIADRLARADPGNAGWQRDLSVSYEKIGDVLVAQGSLPEALKSFQAGLAIRDRLARADPGNAGWQRDLSVSYDSVGGVLVAQGNLPEALKSFQDGLAIRDRLAKADPNNAAWQRDVAVSHAKLAAFYAKTGEPEKARAALGEGKAIMEAMTKLSPDNAEWKRDLAWFEGQVAALKTSPYQEAQAAGQAAFEAKDFGKAAALQAKLAAEIEKAEREKADKPGPATASELLALSWYRLFARDFKGALAASDRAIAIEPETIVLAMNKAHALMFLGRAKEARALYRRYKGQRVKGAGLWEEEILNDFKEFEKRGLKHRQMAEIEALLAAPGPR
ncbi:MAG: caspase family protein [Rhodomicrobium sp.]